MTYRQLTREQRYQIYALKKAAHNRSKIAAISGGHKSTIGRELSRNSGRRGYRLKQADELATARHLAAYRPRISAPT